ncbi:hypothetical protein AXF42_Ash014739 [Apostasia shenzhenica]|uniref:AB hydrolase-1 domain-containing protein n=1 Tax=Apostasia shenzhenica TaxID=1088818 RepID=A0A2H9ZW93_9ASPA|nr:hypothetical protein AXF42_Ash014739 [Apostasia shenzhenica]
MAATSRTVTAASARAHTRGKMAGKSSSVLSGVVVKSSGILLVGLLAWFYRTIQPPPPKLCGDPNGPPITSPRLTLKDGRHLAYFELGVPKEKANYKIIFIHGFDCCKFDIFPVSQELIEELDIYLLSFDRAGYGESDPDPKKTVRSTALDIEELADQLGLGSKFYVMGYSMGGELTWTCLKYIPHRLAGAALVAPVSNYWWAGFPSNLSKEAYSLQTMQDRWAVRVAHYAPWLVYWWNTQKLFPSSSVISHSPVILSSPDLKIRSRFEGRSYAALIRQQGEYESLHRDMIVNFGSWEFDPMDLENPFPNDDGAVHLWHGTKDFLVPVILSRHISQRLPWVNFHEIPDAGHLFPLADGMSDDIVRKLLLGV